jgi:hypothetical protein
MTARTAIDAGIFVCAGVSIGVLTAYRMIDWRKPEGMALAASSLALVCAAVLVVRGGQAGRWLRLIASVVAAVMFGRLEAPAGWDSWVYLNLDDSAFVPRVSAALLQGRIVTPSLVVIALGNALFKRTWLQFGVPVVVLGAWIAYSVTQLPGYIADGIPTEFRLVHSRSLVCGSTRLPWRCCEMERYSLFGRTGGFQYQFDQRVSLGVPGDRTSTIVHAPALWPLRTGPVKRLSGWNTEGWYVALKVGRVFKFATPPQEIKAVFDEIERLPHVEEHPSYVRNVCLGFCYRPFGLDI